MRFFFFFFLVKKGYADAEIPPNFFFIAFFGNYFFFRSRSAAVFNLFFPLVGKKMKKLKISQNLKKKRNAVNLDF